MRTDWPFGILDSTGTRCARMTKLQPWLQRCGCTSWNNQVAARTRTFSPRPTSPTSSHGRRRSARACMSQSGRGCAALPLLRLTAVSDWVVSPATSLGDASPRFATACAYHAGMVQTWKAWCFSRSSDNSTRADCSRVLRSRRAFLLTIFRSIGQNEESIQLRRCGKFVRGDKAGYGSGLGDFLGTWFGFYLDAHCALPREADGMDNCKQKAESASLGALPREALFRKLINTKVAAKSLSLRHYLVQSGFWSLDGEKRKRLLKLG